jgi:hypothetical protein
MYRAVCVSAFFFALLCSRETLASLGFPQTIADHLKLKAPPDCSLCHLSAAGRDAVVQPFGRRAVTYGLIPRDIEVLKRVLTAMEVNGDDSDGDGAGDIVELRNSTDPNDDGSGRGLIDAPRYGFFCTAVPGRGGATGASTPWLIGFFLFAWRASLRFNGRRSTAGPR